MPTADSEQSSADIPVAGPAPLGWRISAWLTAWLLIVYLAIVLPTERVFPAINSWKMVPLLLVGSAVAMYAVLAAVAFRGAGGKGRAQNLALLSVMVLGTMLAADTGITAYTRLAPEFRVDGNRFTAEREHDSVAWDGELMPHVFAPEGKHFWVYKPGQQRRANVYGEHYYTALSRIPLIRDSVLERHDVAFRIDRFGLRNDDPPAAARIFALGDSFTFGYHTSQELIFPALMKASLGEPVYNMGVSGTSPVAHVLLLEHLLRTAPADFMPRRILWLVFEGNDLEESTADTVPQPESRSMNEIFDGTIVGGIAGIPALLRGQSVIRLALGDGTASNTFSRNTAKNHHELDGETLAHPLYRSATFGPRLFRQQYFDRAVRPESYVANHPNLANIRGAFERMKALGDAHDFSVTVVVVPSDVRLYKDAFTDFPPIPAEPYFIRRVEGLARDAGFALVNLHTALAPFAANEMLHYRDDTHWNPRGHRVVADVLLAHLREVDPAPRR